MLTETAPSRGVARTGSEAFREDAAASVTPGFSFLDVPGLGRLLSALHEWEPVDWSEVYDDLDTVLGGEVSHHAAGPSGGRHLPAFPVPQDLTGRLRSALRQLAARGLREEADRRHPDVAVLIARARELIPEALPGDARGAVVPLRRPARITLELASYLDDNGVVTGLPDC